MTKKRTRYLLYPAKDQNNKEVLEFPSEEARSNYARNMNRSLVIPSDFPENDSQQQYTFSAGVLPEVLVTPKTQDSPSQSNPIPTQQLITDLNSPTYQDYIDTRYQSRGPVKTKDNFTLSDWSRNIPKSYWSSDTHRNFKDGMTAASLFTAAPFAAEAAGEYVLPWMSENVFPYLTANGWLKSTQAVGNTPAWLTPKVATAIDATLAGSGTAASVDDMRQNGPTVGNVLGTTLGVGGLVYEAAPTIMEGASLAKRIYDNGTLWDKYTTLGGRFGYYGKTPMSRFVGTVQRRFNFGSPAPRMPELIRAEKHGINFHPEEGIKERFPWINTTTTQPVISHPQGNWNGSDVIIYDPNMIEDPRRYLSIDPMDTFITGKLIPNKGQATVVSGNPNVLRQAKAVGYETVSSPRLRKLYPILQDKNANRPGIPLKLKIKMQPVERTQEALDYMNEIQRLISRRGLPTLRDYQYQSLQTGLPLPNFNPNLSQISLRGRSFASPLRFDTSPSTESNFKIRIGMNRNGTWPDHSPNILDDKGLQEAARNPNYDVNSFQNNPFEGFFNSENMFSK